MNKRARSGLVGVVCLTFGCLGSDESGSSSNPIQMDQATVCHRTGNGRVQRLTMNRNALDAHLRHGDHLPFDVYPDADNDGDGDASAAAVSVCEPLAGHVRTHTDCDDAEPRAHAGAAEVCDGVDNECDGQVDDVAGLGEACTGDGVLTVGVCRSAWVCTGSAGAGPAGLTCRQTVLPGAETCDNRDEDCDGQVDEDLSRGCYSGPAGTEGVGVCRGGAQTCGAGEWGACTGEVLPGTETCDGRDEDCDGLVDETLSQGCYTGPSGTAGVGACRAGTQVCAGGGWGTCAGQVTPIAEVCGNAVDDDCDGQADEGCERCEIVVCNGLNFTGDCQTFGPGVHDFPEINLVVGNDRALSVRVRGGAYAELWEHYTPYNGQTFNGDHATFTADDPDLRDDDNAAASVGIGVLGVSSTFVRCP